MKNFFRAVIGLAFLLSLAITIPRYSSVFAQTVTPAATNQDPLPCSMAPGLGDCPTGLTKLYSKKGEKCVATYKEFSANPAIFHFWALDQEITTQGKADERARQFIYWVINSTAIDEHPIIKNIWTVTKNVSLFLFILVAALFGIGYIVGQRADFQLKIDIWPTLLKIATGLLYILFSYAIVMFFVQISEILMKFFIENMGGKQLFNIYFSGISNENNYKEFIGCRDLNYQVQEAVNAELFLLRLTNITYYVMGVMLLLRRILLWFLLFVSPFLALLMPFVFIRNIAWIWVGVFFQWAFYGPLFALFLGALSKIWRAGIPFIFDFSRAVDADTFIGYVYPTGINITYGGPAQIGIQKLSALNNGNYVDTFVEYVITLIMLWAVTFFPWWLLRIFRDYCCEGINAMKNVLMSMYDQQRSGGPKGPPSISPSPHSATGTALKMPKEIEVPIKVRLETMEEIKKTKTEEITKSLNLSMSNIKDVAKFETNKQTFETVRKNIDNLSQPTKAETPTERQKFMNIRTELFNRTVKEDKVARQILSSISSSTSEHNLRKTEILKSVPQTTPVTQAISYKMNVTQDKVSSLNNTFVSAISSSISAITSIANNAQISAPQVHTVLTSYKQNVSKAPFQIIDTIAKETGLTKEKVVTVVKQITDVMKKDEKIAREVAQKENINVDQLKKAVIAQEQLVTEPEKNIEQTVAIPPSISIEDYEEVKKMWTHQYEKGEVPVSENITSREEWVDQDIVFITNTLNKLMSSDEKLKQEGVDDLAYILPIFLINNLKGEELVVYLKAKLEAAKHVKELKDLEKQVTEKLKSKSKDDEELVELDSTKKQEEAKHMEVSQELEMPEEKTNTAAEPKQETESKP